MRSKRRCFTLLRRLIGPKVTRAEREREGRGEAEGVKTLPRSLRHSRSTSTFDLRQSLNLSPQLLMEVLLRELQAEQWSKWERAFQASGDTEITLNAPRVLKQILKLVFIVQVLRSHRQVEHFRLGHKQSNRHPNSYWKRGRT